MSIDRLKTGHGLNGRLDFRIGRVDLKFLPGFPILQCCRGHSRAVSIRASTRSTSAMAASNAANVEPELVSTDLLSPSAASVDRRARGRASMLVSCWCAARPWRPALTRGAWVLRQLVL